MDILKRGELSGYASYERVVGKIHFAVDPKLVANRTITDIDLATRNPQGLVEFTADLYTLRPVEPATGNGSALFEVPNRGGRGMLGMIDLGRGRPWRSAALPARIYAGLGRLGVGCTEAEHEIHFLGLANVYTPFQWIVIMELFVRSLSLRCPGSSGMNGRS